MSNIKMMPLHTFELSLIITVEEYQNCRNILYATAKEIDAQCFDENEWLNFRGFRSAGVSLSMRKNKNRSGAVVRLQVNPSTLLGKTDPTKLFLPTKKELKDVVSSLGILLRAIKFPRDIEDFCLNRLDICKDVRLEKQEHLMEYLRLFRKGANRSYWTEDCFGDERDGHSVRRKRDDYKVTMYDKIFELSQSDRSKHSTEQFEWHEAYQILRIETALLRPGIREQMQRLEIDYDLSWPNLLMELCISGASIMEDLIDKLIPNGNFYSLNAARIVVQAAGLRYDVQEKLIDYLCETNRHSYLDASKVKIIKNRKKRIQQLYELNINPVTIEARSKIDALPSIQALLLLP